MLGCDKLSIQTHQKKDLRVRIYVWKHKQMQSSVVFGWNVQALLSLFCPCLSPERVVDEGGGAPACYAFIAIVQGALKKVEEEEEEGWGCMGELALLPCERSSIVPGTFQWLPRGPCSNPSPHPNTLFLPSHTHKHTNTHFVHLLMIHTTLSHTVLFSVSCLSYPTFGVSLPCTLHFPLISHKHTHPVPPPSSCLPPVAHYFASLMWLSCQPDSKSKNMQSSHLHHHLLLIQFNLIRGTVFPKCLCRRLNPRSSLAPKPKLIECIQCPLWQHMMV